MKQRSITFAAVFTAVMFAFMSLVFTACEGPAGDPGAAGAQGEQGIQGEKGDQGEQGDSGTAACNECHNVSQDILARSIQWEASKHATGGNFERNGTSCAPCHTSQGFLEVLESGAQFTATAISNPLPQNCWTCHQIHKTYSASDFALTTVDAVTMWNSPGVYDKGKSNLCANCHQTTSWYGVPVVGGPDVEITSPYWGPHHGPQSPMLAGFDGYRVAGSLAYDNSPHYNQVADGCVTCHMADAYGVQAGGHVMGMAYDYHGHPVANTVACLPCHDLEDFDYKNTQTEINNLLGQLNVKLVADGLLDGNGLVIPQTMTADQAGAVYNYNFVYDDGSAGTHNFKFAKALLTNSFESLQ